MRELAVLFLHFLQLLELNRNRCSICAGISARFQPEYATTIIRLLGPGGARSIIAESLLVKQQLLIINRSRQRGPNLRILDRIIAGLCALLMRPTRVVRLAIILKPSTILGFHRSLVKRKYRLLFSPLHREKPGPKGLSLVIIRPRVKIVGFA